MFFFLFCSFNSLLLVVIASHGLPSVDSKNYGITIKEMDQPLLMHRPKERARPGGKVELFFSYFNIITNVLSIIIL